LLHSRSGDLPLRVHRLVGALIVLVGARVELELRPRIVAIDLGLLHCERQDQEGGEDHSAASIRIGSSASIGTIPSFANSAASALSPRLPVVSSLSPVKMLFAPAMKQSAWHASDMLSRPADRRIMDLGIVMRATATVRTNSMSSISA